MKDMSCLPSIVTPPTSSTASRCAACLNVSPGSTWPPGTAQYPFSGRKLRFTRRIFPLLFTTTHAVSCNIISIKQMIFTDRRTVARSAAYGFHHSVQFRKPLAELFLVLLQAHDLDVRTCIHREIRFQVLPPFPYCVHYFHGRRRPIYYRGLRCHHGAMHLQGVVFGEAACGRKIL